MKISDEIVREALKAYDRVAATQCGVPFSSLKGMRAALSAALPKLMLKVEPLEWAHKGDTWKCESHPEYKITRWWLSDRRCAHHFEVEILGADQFGTIDEAKDAAQTYYERLTLEDFAVVKADVDVASVRNSEALFELNKFVTWFDRFICDQDELTSSTPRKVSQNAQDAAVTLKEAIRALSAEPAQGEQWQPIETAPKDGTEILAWREDCGWLIVSYTSLDAFPMTQSELDELDEETLFEKDWFTQFGQIRLEGSEVPTHWMPLPPAPEADE